VSARIKRPYVRRKNSNSVCGVYAIIAPSGGIYVGSSIDIEERWSQHRRDLRRDVHVCPPLQRAWNKYKKHLEWRILVRCDKSRLIEEEQAYIDTRDPKKLYNVNKKADRIIHTPEIRRKLSESGKIVTPARLAHRAKLAEYGRQHGAQFGYKKGIQFPPEHFARLKEANRKLISDPARLAARNRAVSAAKKGKPFSGKTWSWKGKKQSQATIEKRAASNRGKKREPGFGYRIWEARRRNACQHL
jgi:group I intron endonuclease